MVAFNNKRDYVLSLFQKDCQGEALSREEKDFLEFWLPLFRNPRKHEFGRRASFNDYKSPSVYHIILKRAADCRIPFSKVVGDLKCSRNVQICRGKRLNLYRRVCFDPNIRNLPVSHDDNEDFPRCFLTPEGVAIYSEIRKLNKKEEYSIYALAVMPDHVHFVIAVKKDLDRDLGFYIADLKNVICNAVGKRLWADGFADVIIKEPGQLDKTVDYVNDNPRRYLVRKRFPDLFQRLNKLKARWSPRFLIQGYDSGYFTELDKGNTALTSDAETIEFKGIGNPLLLKAIDKGAVRVSSKYSPEERARRYAFWREIIDKKGVLISPFISESEKEIREMALEEGGSIVVLTNRYIDIRSKPTRRDFELCREGRYLEISCYDACRKARKICLRRERLCRKEHPDCEKESGRLCRCDSLAMNELADLIAAGDFFGWLG